jgi:hypothetical protein
MGPLKNPQKLRQSPLITGTQDYTDFYRRRSICAICFFPLDAGSRENKRLLSGIIGVIIKKDFSEVS